MIEVMRMRTEGDLVKNKREQDLREREIALQERRMRLEELKFEASQRPQNQVQVGQFQTGADGWSYN